jgi:hypothetical protein
MQKKGANISLKGYDDIFSTDQSRAEAHFTHNLLRTPTNARVISPIGTAITFRLGFRRQRD